MVVNLCGKKVRTHWVDDIRYVFTPIEQSYNGNLKNILLWSARLVGLFEIEWITHRHNILVEFLNNWKLNPKHNRIKVMLGEE